MNPKASNGHEYILVAIDYFTKRIEAVSYARITAVVRFMKNHRICRFGVPAETDNGTHFVNKKVSHQSRVLPAVQDQSSQVDRLSSPNKWRGGSCQQDSGQDNREVKTHRDWHEMLPFALWAYRTSIRTPTGLEPFSLVYGTEAVLPVEIEIPSLRVLIESEDLQERKRKRLAQLYLLDEKRLRALDHMNCYQRRIARAYAKKVKISWRQV